MNEVEYWNKAAKDPQVEQKYIANVPLEDCLEAIVNHLLAGSILDIGCGIGRLTTPIAEGAPSCKLYGIDISEAMLKLTPPSSAKYKLCDGSKIPYSDESFESVYSMLVFQHVDDATMFSYIEEAYRVLKDNGIFRFQFVEGYYHGFVDHNRKPSTVIQWLKTIGFKIIKIDEGLVLPQWIWITAIKQ